MNGIAIEVGGPRGSRLAGVRVQGLVCGKPVMLDVGVVCEDPLTGEWVIRGVEPAGNSFCNGLRFPASGFLDAVECAAKS